MSDPKSDTAPPQTSNIFVDRPCLKCGYNLRGQTAVWNRRALNWQVSCPECNNAQVVQLGSNERGTRQPAVVLALALAAAWAAWQLLEWMATPTALAIGPPDATMMRAIAAGGAPTGGFTGVLLLDYDALAIVAYFLMHSIPLSFASLLLGAILSIAPHARKQDRNFLVLLLSLLATLYGWYLNVTGQVPKLTDTSPSTLKWKLLAATVALLVCIVGGRLGLILGPPFVKMVARMYVRPTE